MRSLRNGFALSQVTSGSWNNLRTLHSQYCDRCTLMSTPISGCVELAKQVLRYLQGVENKCLQVNLDSCSDLVLSTDSDWGGMYKIMGDPRSRTGILATYRGMPVLSKSSWQNIKGISAITLPTFDSRILTTAKMQMVMGSLSSLSHQPREKQWQLLKEQRSGCTYSTCLKKWAER